MTKRTQRFVVLGVTVLVVGLGTGLVASYVGFPNLGIVGSDGPAELAYVPSDPPSSPLRTFAKSWTPRFARSC